MIPFQDDETSPWRESAAEAESSAWADSPAEAGSSAWADSPAEAGSSAWADSPAGKEGPLSVSSVHLEAYRIFLYAAKLGSLTKAAQQLYITQPTVSYAIKQLERHLSVTLFNRRSRGVSLTPEGETLLRFVEPSFSLLEAGEKEMNAMKDLSSGVLKLGASDTLIRMCLLQPLDEFRRRFPDIRIRLTHGRTPDIVRRLLEGEIECGLVRLPLSQDSRLHLQPLTDVEECFVVGQTYRHLANRGALREIWPELPLLMLSSGSSSRRFTEQWLHEQGLFKEPDMELGSIDLLLEFARLGFGAALIPRSLVERELDKGLLFEVQLPAPLPSRKLALASLKDRSLSLAARAFAEQVAKAYPSCGPSV
ncbi:LysR family transcriptional regulator [Paenibacillus senegalensis]|uniref:LysR family transcriptional regulator n=1 Tax=Paenibacillus senegalensis TaxID=1465766 RepID=UPI000288BE3D|nr:LysR family transcriptional regulator [Paenibacillus senegalensis]